MAMVVYKKPKKKVVKKVPASQMRYVVPYRKLRGRGDYTYDKPGPWGKYGRVGGEAAGSAIGNRAFGPIGGKVGSFLGGKLGSYLHYIGKIFGSGDYATSPNSVKYNVLVNEGQVPKFASAKSDIHIQHREYLCDIYSSGTTGSFQLQSFPINPGNVDTFPWLSQVAGTSFQQYRVNGMVFEFRSMSADALNSTNTALGSVVMATDYDSQNISFNSKAQMENTEYGVSCKPSSCAIHAIECARNQTSITELYVNPDLNVPSGSDSRLYNLGNFQIATVGFQGANVNCGELWCSYDISLLKPIQLSPGAGVQQTVYDLTGATGSIPLQLDTSVFSNQPRFDSIGCLLDATASTITLPYNDPTNSVYNLNFGYRGATTGGLIPPAVTYSNGLHSNGTVINAMSGGFNAPQGATGTTTMDSSYFYYDGTGTIDNPPTINIGKSGVLPTTSQGGTIIITRINGQLLDP